MCHSCAVGETTVAVNSNAHFKAEDLAEVFWSHRCESQAYSEGINQLGYVKPSVIQDCFVFFASCYAAMLAEAVRLACERCAVDALVGFLHVISV